VVTRWQIIDRRYGTLIEEIEAERFNDASPARFYDADGQVVFEVTSFALPHVWIVRVEERAC
jgi:hypothetical protein